MKWVIRLAGGLVAIVVLAVLVLFGLSRRPGAADTRVAVEIARPPEVVWGWITDPAKSKRWVSWLAEVRLDTPGVDGVGARETWFMDDPNMKQRIAVTSVVREIDRPRRLVVHLEMAKAFEGDCTYLLTPTAAGTRLEQLGQWHYDDPFARLMVPLITPQADAKGRADFARLKAMIEAS